MSIAATIDRFAHRMEKSAPPGCFGEMDAEWPRWTEFQELCRAECAQYERVSLPGLPVISSGTAEADQPSAVEDFLLM